MKRLFWLILIGMMLAPLVRGQSFEVASIRLHKTQIQVVGSKISGPRLIAEAMSADNLITYAYDVKDYQVSGVPSWADSQNLGCDRYDVTAKAEGDAPLKTDQARSCSRVCLANGFTSSFIAK